MSRIFALAIFSVGLAYASFAAPPDELKPRTATFPAGKMSLRDALTLLHKQTGNVVHDRRAQSTDPSVSLPATPITFWQAMDAIGKQTGIGISAYQPQGAVALTDASFRLLSTHDSGIFRFANKRREVTQNDETEAHRCRVTLDISWEPRFQPLFLGLEQATVRYAKDAKGASREEKLHSQTLTDIEGIGAMEVDVIVNAPDRSAPSIDLLQGRIQVIGPPKMLEFILPRVNTKAQTAEQEGIAVRASQWESTRNRISVEVAIDNPPGAAELLHESYRASSWMNNNRIWLEWTDPKTKMKHKLEPGGQQPIASAKGTAFRYHFTPGNGTPLPSASVNPALRCLTPNRIVAFTVPFEFRNLPLP